MKRKLTMISVCTLVAALAAGGALAGKRKFTAVCNTVHGLGGSWWGDDRDTRAEAQADLDAHKKDYPNHSPGIWDRVD